MIYTLEDIYNLELSQQRLLNSIVPAKIICVYNIVHTMSNTTNTIIGTTLMWQQQESLNVFTYHAVKIDAESKITDRYKVYPYADPITSEEINIDGNVIASYIYDSAQCTETKVDPITKDVLQVNYLVSDLHPLPNALKNMVEYCLPTSIIVKIWAHKPYGDVVYFSTKYKPK